MWLHPWAVERLSNASVGVVKSPRTFLNGHLTGYRGCEQVGLVGEQEMTHTWTFLPLLPSKKAIHLCLSIAGMDSTTPKRPIALLTPMCTAAPRTGQLFRSPKVFRIHWGCSMTPMMVHSLPQLYHYSNETSNLGHSTVMENFSISNFTHLINSASSSPRVSTSSRVMTNNMLINMSSTEVQRCPPQGSSGRL
jgi:hypothetical protein